MSFSYLVFSAIVRFIFRGQLVWSSASCFRLPSGYCVLNEVGVTFEEDVIMLSDFLFDEPIGMFGVHAGKGFDEWFSPGLAGVTFRVVVLGEAGWRRI